MTWISIISISGGKRGMIPLALPRVPVEVVKGEEREREREGHRGRGRVVRLKDPLLTPILTPVVVV